jgi:parvulin-like peptidyl-prolyl isomerase
VAAIWLSRRQDGGCLRPSAARAREGQISASSKREHGFHIIRRVKPELIRVSHILITHAGAGGMEVSATRGRDEALQVALDVLFRARKGEDFAELAREYSDDRMTADKGGRLPMIDRGQTVPQFEEAVFSLAPGEISDVVETQFGFHVIKRLY